MSSAGARIDLNGVLRRYKKLTYHGFFVKGEGRDYQKERDGFSSEKAIYEFQQAGMWLGLLEHLGRINKKAGNSYSFKHTAEAYIGERVAAGAKVEGYDEYGAYISNGSLIAAAISMGFRVSPCGINAYLNIPSQSAGMKGSQLDRDVPFALTGWSPDGICYGIVYFMQPQGQADMPIKIGITADVKERAREIGSNWPWPMSVLACFNGNLSTEAALHERFKAMRVEARGREWFWPHPDLLEFIEQVKRAKAEVVKT